MRLHVAQHKHTHYVQQLQHTHNKHTHTVTGEVLEVWDSAGQESISSVTLEQNLHFSCAPMWKKHQELYYIYICV